MWLRLNTVLPRSLWALTIKALQHNNGASMFKEENLMQDPLQVLQCDARVYRYVIIRYYGLFSSLIVRY